MQPLDRDTLRRLRQARQQIGVGIALEQAQMDALLAEWTPLAQPDEKDLSEYFGVARPDGSLTGVSGPRWIFHLFGLLHRAAHVGLTAPSGLVLLQRRSATKMDWPNAWDMAAAGHVPLYPNGREMRFEEGAKKEIEEELGLPSLELGELVQEGQLSPVGAPYCSFDMDETRNPPFYNAEVRQVFGATLNEAGMSRLRPDYEELSGLYFCTVEKAWGILTQESAATGLLYSLPRYLDWLMKKDIRIL